MSEREEMLAAPCPMCNGIKRALYFSEVAWKSEERDCHLCAVSRPQGCGYHNCNDPNCTYGKGPNTDPISRPHQPGEA